MVNCPKGLLILLTALFAVQTSHGRTVQSVEIRTVGMDNSGQEAAARACKKFRPTKAQVTRFFSRAYPIESRFALHERYSSCYAEGSVKFTDGHRGTWILYSGGTAVLTPPKGDAVDLFYKHNKWHDPYACTYGLSDEGEC